MPIPKPHKREKRNDFLPRCIRTISGEYSNHNQAIAICESQWERRHMSKFEISTQITKVDESLGLVMGFAIICKQDGEPYFDLQGDHIPEDAMLKAALDFMENSQIAKEMHSGDQQGSVVFAWPLTEETAKAFGIETKQTGLMIGMRPSADMLEKFKSGELTGFSIGGVIVDKEDVEDA